MFQVLPYSCAHDLVNFAMLLKVMNMLESLLTLVVYIVVGLGRRPSFQGKMLS